MTEDVVRSGKETWAGSGAPGVNHNDANRIKLRSGDVYGYLRMRNPVPDGLTVVSADLALPVAKASEWAGTKTIGVKRLSERKPFGRITWDNKPGTVGATKFSDPVTDPVNGQYIHIDVTSHVTQWTGGDPNYGWRIETDSATAHRLHGFDSDYPPILTVEYAISPSQPVDLVPAGGSVSVQYPVHQFDAVDLENPQDITDLQIQFDAVGGDFTAPSFDTGWVASSVPEWDPTGSAWAGIANGASVDWRCRFRNGTVVGDWSDPVTYSRTDKSALTIDNPAAAPNNFVTESTPPFIHTFAGTQVAWRKWITPANDHTDIIANSHKTDGTETSWTPPKKKLHDDHTYTIHVRVWDDVERVHSPGDPIYTYASRDFTMDDDLAQPVPTLVSAVQDGESPFVVLTWTIATAPDSFTIIRDGEVIESGLDPADLLSGGQYTWTDATAPPQAAHTYKVRGVVNGAQSVKSNGLSVTTYPEGVWLLDVDNGRYVHVISTGVGNWRRTDQVGIYRPIGRKPIQVYMGDDGISFQNFVGELQNSDGRTVEQWRADFKAMAAKPTRTYQLVAGFLSIPVNISNASVTPHPDSLPPGTPRDQVVFDAFEVDEDEA